MYTSSKGRERLTIVIAAFLALGNRLAGFFSLLAAGATTLTSSPPVKPPTTSSSLPLPLRSFLRWFDIARSIDRFDPSEREWAWVEGECLGGKEEESVLRCTEEEEVERRE